VPETVDTRFERAGRNAEHLRCAVDAVHLAAAGSQRLLDLLALVAGILVFGGNGR